MKMKYKMFAHLNQKEVKNNSSTRVDTAKSKFSFMMIISVAMLIGSAESTEASIIVVDNGSTLTTTWDETFSLTRNMDWSGRIHGIVFDNMFADNFTIGNPVNPVYDIRASVNGGADILLSPWAGWNYRVGIDRWGNGWSDASLGILWGQNTLGGAMANDSVRLFGSMTHDKGGFHHLPDYAATTVTFSAYNAPSFSDSQSVSVAPSTVTAATFSGSKSVSSVPEPSIIALFAAGLFGIGFARRRKA
jgi:hypothetical protein